MLRKMVSIPKNIRFITCILLLGMLFVWLYIFPHDVCMRGNGGLPEFEIRNDYSEYKSFGTAVPQPEWKEIRSSCPTENAFNCYYDPFKIRKKRFTKLEAYFSNMVIKTTSGGVVTRVRYLPLIGVWSVRKQYGSTPSYGDEFVIERCSGSYFPLILIKS